jgi:AcrR family transcriptional regulator
MNISPGNLYYHFRNKDEIVNDIFAQFRREIGAILSVPEERQASVEDVWLFLHLLFETIWKYRFLYRDLNDLLARNRTLEIHFKSILADKVQAISRFSRGLVESGEMESDLLDDVAFATNITLVATYWLSFAFARDPRHFEAGNVLAQGAYQTLVMFAPHLRGSGRELFTKLAAEYIRR